MWTQKIIESTICISPALTSQTLHPMSIACGSFSAPSVVIGIGSVREAKAYDRMMATLATREAVYTFARIRFKIFRALMSPS